MIVRAHAVEPEFVYVKDIGGGAAEIILEMAYISVTEGKGTREVHGYVNLSLLASDVETVLGGLRKISEA